MKYRIVGADGNTYGPVSLDQIRQWLAEGRVDRRTPVYVEGAASWTYVGLLPEFAPAPTPPPTASVPPQPRGTIQPSAVYRGTNGLATASLICGLLAWTVCCCCGGFPLNLLGLIFAIIALVQIGSQTDPQNGRAFAIIGLVLSALSLAYGLFSFALPAISNPGSFHWSTSFQ